MLRVRGPSTAHLDTLAYVHEELRTTYRVGWHGLDWGLHMIHRPTSIHQAHALSGHACTFCRLLLLTPSTRFHPIFLQQPHQPVVGQHCGVGPHEHQPAGGPQCYRRRHLALYQLAGSVYFGKQDCRTMMRALTSLSTTSPPCPNPYQSCLGTSLVLVARACTGHSLPLRMCGPFCMVFVAHSSSNRTPNALFPFA